MIDAGQPTPATHLRLNLLELEGQARHADERYRLYRAKAYGPRLTSPAHLRQLERESQLARSRLERAKDAAPPGRITES